MSKAKYEELKARGHNHSRASRTVLRPYFVCSLHPAEKRRAVRQGVQGTSGGYCDINGDMTEMKSSKRKKREAKKYRENLKKRKFALYIKFKLDKRQEVRYV